MKRVALSFILIIFGLIYANTLSEKSNLERLLRDSEIKVTLNGKKFEVKQGKIVDKAKNALGILRLAAFYEWTREDPLFTSPDFDFTKFQASISDIDKSQKEILAFTKTKGHLYPVDFLRAVSNVAIKNKAFIDSPSDNNAHNLVSAQITAADLYKKEAESLLDSVSSSKYGSPVFINITADTNTVINDMRLILKNADELKAEVNKRKNCLEGKSGCVRPAFTFKRPKETKELKQDKPSFIDKDTIFYNKPNLPAIIRGPYIAQTPCYGWGDNFSYRNEYFYVLYNSAKQTSFGAPIANIEQATNMYFDNIAKDTQVNYKQELTQRGIPYAVSTSTAPYKCPYFGHLAEVLTLDSFLSRYKPLFPRAESEIKDTGFFKQGSQFESDLFAKKYPSYEEARELATFYGYAYRLMVEYKNSPLLKEQFLKRKLEIERELSQVNQLLDYANWFSIQILDFQKSEQRDNPKLAQDILYPLFVSTTVYPFRSYYGLMYFPFSHSFWRIDQTPEYLKKIIVKGSLGLDRPYLDYQTALKKYSPEEIKKWLIPREEILHY